MSSLESRALEHVQKVHAFWQETARDDLAATVAGISNGHLGNALTIEVVGDIKRGKSRFINALLDMPNFLPVDPDVATSVHTQIRYSATPSAAVNLRVPPDYESAVRTIALEEVAEYTSALEQPPVDPGADVLYVDVGLDQPILQDGLSIVDTPGIGGTTGRHKQLTLAALELADIVLFCVSVDAPILRSELDFLRDAMRHPPPVVFLLTKIDSTPAWPDLLKEDQQRLESYYLQLRDEALQDNANPELQTIAQRFEQVLESAWMPVSSRLEEKANELEKAGASDSAQELHDQSGFLAIQNFISASIASRELVLLGAALAACDAGLTAMIAGQTASSKALMANETLAARINELSDDIDRVAPDRDSRLRYIAKELNRLESDAHVHLGRALRSTAEDYTSQARQGTGAANNLAERLKTLPDDLVVSFQRAWTSVVSTIRADVADFVGTLERTDQESAPDTASSTGIARLQGILFPAELAELATRKANPARSKFDIVQDGVPLTTQTYILMNIANHVGIGSIALLGGPLTIGLALGAGVAGAVVYKNMKKRAQTSNQQEYERLVFDCTQAAQRELYAQISNNFNELRSDLQEFTIASAQNLTKSLESQRDSLIDVLRAEEDQRLRAQADITATTEGASSLLHTSQALLSDIYQHLSTPPSPELEPSDE